MGMITDFFYCEPSDLAIRFAGWVVPGPEWQPTKAPDASNWSDPLEGLDVLRMKRVDDVTFGQLARALGVTQPTGEVRLSHSGEAYVQVVVPVMRDGLAAMNETHVATFVEFCREDYESIPNQGIRAAALASCSIQNWSPWLRELASFADRADGRAMYRFCSV